MVLLLQDRNIIYEDMLEDISNILNKGEVPNLFDKLKIKVPESLLNYIKNEIKREEIISKIIEKDKNKSRNLDNSKLWNLFIENVKEKLHIILVQSPNDSDFRFRLRTFPSLINCANICWFHAWPEDALIETAKYTFTDLNLSEELKSKIINISCKIHSSVKQLSEKYKLEEKRYNYVTPTSFLDLLKSFKN